MREKVLHSFWQTYRLKLLLSILIYSIMCVFGYIYQQTQENIPLNPVDHSWIYYFSHNIKAAGTMILLGVLSYGIVGYLFLILNGFTLGIGVQVLLQNQVPDLIFSRLLPHAVPEIGGIILASTVPFVFWKGVVNLRRRSKKKSLIFYELLFSLVSCIFLFLLAAIIESNT